MGWLKNWFKKGPSQENENTSSEEVARTGAKYHVSQNKDEHSTHYKAWRVRKEGSQKTIQYFKTQKEAVDFAYTLAKRHHASVIIHKVDGTIRKQRY